MEFELTGVCILFFSDAGLYRKSTEKSTIKRDDDRKVNI